MLCARKPSEEDSIAGVGTALFRERPVDSLKQGHLHAQLPDRIDQVFDGFSDFGGAGTRIDFFLQLLKILLNRASTVTLEAAVPGVVHGPMPATSFTLTIRIVMPMGIERRCFVQFE